MRPWVVSAAACVVCTAAFGSPAFAQDKVQLEVETLAAGRLTTENRLFFVDTLALQVPENRADTASRTITVPVVRIHSRRSNQEEPVFWLGGGPGQTNLTHFDYDYFIDWHDHVMVGYRGVDGSTSLDCPEVSDVLRHVDDVLQDVALNRVGDAFTRCWNRLTAAGVDINGYTMIEVVRDMDEARKELGYDQIDIVAESYGTRLAYLYALVYPENVHRMILVGAQPPGGMIWNPYQQDDILRAYGRLWSENKRASARYPDLVGAIRSVNHDMPRRWLFLPIHPGNVKVSAQAMLFHRASAAKVFDAYVAAAKGDASGLWLISVVAPFIFPEIVNWGDNASKAVSADYTPGRDLQHELLPSDAVMGAPLGSFLWARAALWPIRPMPEEYRKPDTSFVQTLIISGNLDFSTPAENVTTGLMPYLPNGRQVVLSDMGHIVDLWRVDPDATFQLVTSFLEKGVADTSAVAYVPMNFHTKWGFPLLAKLIVTGALVAALIILGLIWVIVWVVRRRKAR